MTETEVERLVVRLVGDSTSYVKMLTDAQKKTQEAVGKVEQAANKIEKFQKGLEGFAATATKALGAVGIASGLKELYEQFDEADDLITELSAVIKANGRSVDDVLPKYQELAKEMRGLTTSTKDSVLEMAKQAEVMSLTDGQAKRAIKNAIALAAIRGGDATSYLRQTGNFEKTGNVTMLARVLGIVGEMEDGADKAAEAMKRLEIGWELALTKGADGGTRIERAFESMKEVGKEAGKVIAGVFEPMIDQLESAVSAFNAIDPATRKTIVTMVLLIATVKAAQLVWQTLIVAVIEYGKAVAAAALANPVLTVAILALAAALTVVIHEQSKFNAALEEGAKLSKKSASSYEKQLKGATKEQIDKDVAGLSSRLGQAKQNLEEKDTSKRSIPLFGMGYQAEYDEAKQQVEELQRLYDAAKKAQTEMGKAARDAEEAMKQPSKETVAAINELTDGLKLQLETVGMSSEQAQIYALRQKTMGDESLNASLDLAEYNAQMLEAAKAQRAAIDSAKGLIKSMEFQIATWGMSESAALRYKLTMEGVDDATIDRAVALQEELESMEELEKMWDDVGESVKATREQYQALNAVVAGGADAAQLIYQYANQFGDDTKAVNKAATMRRADFTAQPDRNFLGPQVKNADATKELEKRLDEQTTILKQIRDKEGVTLGEADLSA